MQKMSSRGSSFFGGIFHGFCRKHDEGSILGLTVLVLLCFVVAAGLLLRASYAEYKKVHEDLENVSLHIAGRAVYETC